MAVRNAAGRRDLVLVRLPATITTLISEPDTQFNAPRWSPDGRAIAVERHRLGRSSEVVVVDVATRGIRAVVSDARARWVTPAWRPDGQAIVAAADVGDAAFNLYEVSLDAPLSPRPITHTTGGARWPDVSTDGSTIIYVGYTADGFDLFQMPYPKPAPEASSTGSENSRRAESGEAPATAVRPRYDPADAHPYSPWPTLVPNWWSPIIAGSRNQLRVGAATSGVDVLGYHGYSASATRFLTTPEGTPAVEADTPDWQLFYVYDRWRPAPWVSASRETSFFAGPPSDRGVPSTATLHSQQLQMGISFPVRHVRVSQTALLAVVRAADDFVYPDHTDSQHRTAVRAGWVIGSAHTYGYSISPEGGALFGVTAELAQPRAALAAGAAAVTADARVYLPGIAPHHVLALRVAGGTASGDRNLRRSFNLGGGGPNANPLDFGREVISLLRGFPADTFAGTHVALMNADYRWPIVRPQRGVGTWPFFLQTVYAAAFADVGHAWTRAFSSRDLKTSAGAELSADAVIGYFFPFTATVGVAWGHDGSHAVADRSTVYVRFARAF